MKVLTEKQIEEMNLHWKNPRGKSKIVFDAILSMKPGQALFISSADWEETRLKSDPVNIITSGTKHPRSAIFGQKLSVQSAEEGWVIRKRE